MPLRELIRISGRDDLLPLSDKGLLHSAVNIVGIGLTGQPKSELAEKCWIYFPEDNCPFYRATVFSNYSPANVPDPARYWSLMCEVSELVYKPVDQNSLCSEVVAGAVNTRLISNCEDIASVWSFRTHTAIRRQVSIGMRFWRN